MRNAFAEEITKLAQTDARLVLLSADIGNRLFDKFKIQCPDRFYNTGVAEANTMSMAAGMASCGLRPFCYTITPFITSRCFEQIKIDVCYHKMPVVIVGTGSGLSYASLGATHHSLEDMGIMRTLPEMRVLAPADANELRSCLRSSLKADHPVYIRIGKKGEPVIFPEPPSFSFGQWQQVQKGQRICILATGNMLSTALESAELLARSGTQPAVFACASVKPLDQHRLAEIFHEFDLVASVEEHFLIGGFGAAIAEWLADSPEVPRARLMRFGVGDLFMHEAGEQEHARHLFGLTHQAMATRIAGAISL
jgi:transketolase